MPQITPITSESLQAKIRQLLPSQVGFGEDLQAQNVIVPVIDLTTTAEGSGLDVSMQQALNFGGATAFDVSNTTTTVANTAGFYRLTANCSARQASGSDVKGQVILSDGSTDKIAWQMTIDALSSTLGYTQSVDYIIFLRSADLIKISTNNTSCFFVGSVRQVADVSGVLVNPTGFTPQ